MPLLKNGVRVEDGFHRVAEGAALPERGALLLDAERFLSEARALEGRSDPIGVIWPNARPVEDLEPHLRRTALVALVFPTFRDGRAYSQARQLRERLGFKGELRATGDVLRDQFLFMMRAGFDAFEVKKDADADAFAETIARYPIAYQPTARGRLRQRLEAAE